MMIIDNKKPKKHFHVDSIEDDVNRTKVEKKEKCVCLAYVKREGYDFENGT